MPRDQAILLDIAKAAQLVILFVEAMTKEQFMQDIKTQSAVQHQLLVLGEAVKRLSQPFRDQHAAIPWSLMAGMRNHLFMAMIRSVSTKSGIRPRGTFRRW